MKLMLFYYRLWLSIIATNVINLSMILFSIKRNLKNMSGNIQKNISTYDKSVNEDGRREEYMSQLEKVREENTIRVAIVGDKAYWVQSNTFYESDVIDGLIDIDATRAVDAHKLSKKEITQLLEILDQIRN